MIEVVTLLCPLSPNILDITFRSKNNYTNRMEIKARVNKCAWSEFGYNSQKHVALHVEHKIRILATLARESYFIYKRNDIL